MRDDSGDEIRKNPKENRGEEPQDEESRTSINDSVGGILPSLERSEYPENEEELHYSEDRSVEEFAKFLSGMQTRIERFVYVSPAPGLVTSWGSGGLLGNVGSFSIYGRMGVEHGSLSLIQNVGRFTFTATAGAYKYGYFRGLSTSWGFGGSATYHASDRVSLTVFGNYWSKPGINQPGMNAFVQLPSFGGYVDYSISDHWGVKVGGSAFRSSLTGRWEAMPNVTPYYRFNNGQELGIDVGSILYEVLRENIGGGRGMNMNPSPSIPAIGPLPVGRVLPPPVP